MFKCRSMREECPFEQRAEIQNEYIAIIAKLCKLFHEDFVRLVQGVSDDFLEQCRTVGVDNMQIGLGDESPGETEGQLLIGLGFGKGVTTPDDVEMCMIGPQASHTLLSKLDSIDLQRLYLIAYRTRWLYLDQLVEIFEGNDFDRSKIENRRDELLERYQSVVEHLQ